MAFKKIFLASSLLLFLNVATSQAQDYSKLNAKIDSALSLQANQHFNESTALLNTLSDEINASAPKDLQFKYYQNLAYNLFITWELQKAEYAAKSAVNIAELNQDSIQILRAYSILANIYSKQKRDEQSIYYQKKALNLLGPADSVNYYAILINLTNSLSASKQIDEALSNLIRAKNFYERTGNLHSISLTENNIGELYRSGYRDYPRAILHYRAAQRINSQNDFTKDLIQNYHNLGLVFLKMDQIDSALINVRESIRLRKSIGDEAGTVHGYNLMGQVYLKENKIDRAIESYNNMLAISEKYGIDPGVYYAHIGLADTYYAKNDKSEELKQLRLAKRSSDLMKSTDIQSEIAKRLYLFYKEQGDFRGALQAHETLFALDSAEKQTKNQALLDEQKIKYENKLALKENEMLKTREKSRTEQLAAQRKILIYLCIGLVLVLLLATFLYIAYRQRRKAYRALEKAQSKLEEQFETSKMHEANLKRANDLKVLIFSVIGHDLREPLTALSQILSLAGSGDLTKDEMDVLLEHIQGQTNKNLKSLQDILLWAKAQMDNGSIHQKSFDANEVVGETIEKNREALNRKEIRVTADIEEGSIVWADLNQFRSIVQNLLSNAIKFSPFGESIIISIKESDSGYTLKVKDHGAGVSNDFLQKIRHSFEATSTRGTDGETGTGIGLMLVNEFTKAHRGKFYFAKNEPKGTIAVVEFPRKEAFEKKEKLTDAA